MADRQVVLLAQTRFAAVAALLMVSVSSAAWAEDGKESREGVRVNVGGNDAGSYWIGLLCEEASDALRLRLKLDRNEGVLVHIVVPDSAAEKALLRPNDVITHAGDKPVGKVGELIKFVAESKGSELKLRVLRAGEPTTIVVKPAKRKDSPALPRARLNPQSEDGVPPAHREDSNRAIRFSELAGDDETTLKKALEYYRGWRLGEEKRGEDELTGRFRKAEEKVRQELEHVKQQLQNALRQADAEINQRELSEKQEQETQPSQTSAARGAASQAAVELPDDMQININKKGKQPATITVKQGEKIWETTEDKLDKLPADVRGHVMRMLGQR